MNDLQIRPCQMHDLPVVRELLQQLGEVAHEGSRLKLDHIQKLFEEMAAQPDIYLNLVAVAEGQVTGFISLIFYKTLWHHGGTALINELVVQRELRGAGIGRALIGRAIAEAHTRGMDEIEVGTEEDNHRALGFYHRCGFDEEYVLLGMEFD